MRSCARRALADAGRWRWRALPPRKLLRADCARLALGAADGATGAACADFGRALVGDVRLLGLVVF
jgi:hypothetical protein